MKKPTNGRRLTQIALLVEALIEARDTAKPRSAWDLADDLGVSRTTIRDWLRVLSTSGLAVPAKTISTGPKGHETVLWRWTLVGGASRPASGPRLPV